MKKQLFFDDNKLFGRDNVVRKYGKPEVVATYNDGICSTDYCTGNVFRLDNGKYRMLYFAHSQKFEGRKLFAAISDDGVHFSPEEIYDTTVNTDKMFPNEIMTLQYGWEVGYIYEDKYCENSQERYKLLMSQHNPAQFAVEDAIYTSGDLINWTKMVDLTWGDGAEPLVGVFYNKHKGVHTILERPFWGVRYVGYKETKDWKTFTDYQVCVNVDSNDERLCEVYGMPAFEYDGIYIGIPHIYRHLNSELNAKFKNGIIDTQLVYSEDGRYWRRSIREPFITGLSSDGTNYNMIWVPCMLKHDDGDIYFYCSASELEHGPAFSQPGTGTMLIQRMRNDGFISLSTKDSNEISSIATREKVWHGGELHVNLKAKKATLAVYVSDESELVTGNALGIARALDGYSHEDCIEFCGDSTDWVPEYRSGKCINDLVGKTLVFELKFEDGEVFSFSGDYTDVYNTQAARYRKFGVLPE